MRRLGSGSATAGGGAASTSGSPAPATTTVTVTASGGSGTVGSGGPSATRPGSTTTLLPRCDASLKVSVGAPDGAAGTVYRTIVFRNASGVACTLQGYPGVAAADAAGKPVVDATRDTSRGPQRVVLAPGASAHAVLGARNIPGGSEACTTYAQLLVTPPDSRRTTMLPIAVTPCERFLRVGPVLAGASSS